MPHIVEPTRAVQGARRPLARSAPALSESLMFDGRKYLGTGRRLWPYGPKTCSPVWA